MRTLGVTILLAIAALQATSEGSQEPTGTLAGTVVDFDGRPIEGATVSVRLNKGGAASQQILTTSAGRFVWNLPLGTYFVSARKAGYLTEAAAKRFYAGADTEVVLRSDSARVLNVVMKLAKAATVSGVVRDEANQPIVNAHVRFLRAWAVGGREHFELKDFTTTLSTKTNDRGEYRATMVPPGTYLAAVVDGRLRDLANREAYGLPTLYPGTTELSQAVPLTIGIAEDRTAIDFQLRPSYRYAISGRVTGVEVEFGTIVRLVRTNTGPINGEMEVTRARTMKTGEFRFAGVAAGTYTLSVVEFPKDDDGRAMQMWSYMEASGGAGYGSLPPAADWYDSRKTYWAELPLTVEKDISDLVIPVQTGKQLCGKAEFDGASSVPPLAPLQRPPQVIFLRPDSINVQLPVSVAHADGHFCSAELPPGRYHPLPLIWFPGWHLTAVRHNGRTITGQPVEPGNEYTFVYSNRDSELRGTVANQKGDVVTNGSVVAFPADSSLWTDFGPRPLMIQTVRTDGKGSYQFKNLPEGKYRVVAMAEPVRQDWTLAENLRALSAVAKDAEIKPGLSVLLNLVAVPGRK